MLLQLRLLSVPLLMSVPRPRPPRPLHLLTTPYQTAESGLVSHCFSGPISNIAPGFPSLVGCTTSHPALGSGGGTTDIVGGGLDIAAGSCLSSSESSATLGS